MLVAESAAEFDSLRARVAELNRLGFTHEELIDAAELRRLVPAVAGELPGGIVSRRDGAAESDRTTIAFTRKAEALGVPFFEGMPATTLEGAGGRVAHPMSGERHAAPVSSMRAGAWADRIAADLGEPCRSRSSRRC